MPTVYPVDYSGNAVSNKILNENITLSLPSNTRYRAFTPVNGPYFLNSIAIKDLTSNQTLTKSQYVPFFLIQAATAKTSTAGAVYSVIIITDSSVSNNLAITYQTIGGDYVGDYANIVNLVNLAINDTRSVDWDNITNHVMTYDAAYHTHDLTSLNDLDILTLTIEKLCTAVTLGDTIAQDSLLAYADKLVNSYVSILNNLALPGTPLGNHINSTTAHSYTAASFGLGNVSNYAVATASDVLLGTSSSLYVTLDNAKLMINNNLNGGINAHILNVSNPHNLTKAQVGLGYLYNYGIATLADIITPNPSNPLYVTSDVVSNYLTSYLGTLASQYTLDKKSFTDSINAALTQSQDTLTSITSAINTLNTQNSTLSTLATAANNAIATTQQLSDNASNQQAAALALIQQYLTPALTATQASAYASGYADGSKVT